MTELIVHPEAIVEYDEALAWYLERSPQAADRFEAAFDEAVESIRSRPTLYPSDDGVHRYVVLPRYPYRLIYRLEGDTATIVAVAHARKLPGDWWGRI